MKNSSFPQRDGHFDPHFLFQISKLPALAEHQWLAALNDALCEPKPQVLAVEIDAGGQSRCVTLKVWPWQNAPAAGEVCAPPEGGPADYAVDDVLMVDGVEWVHVTFGAIQGYASARALPACEEPYWRKDDTWSAAGEQLQKKAEAAAARADKAWFESNGWSPP